MQRRKISRPDAYIPPPESKASRDRSWEEKQRNHPGFCQVSFRRIPEWVRERLNEIAGEHYVIRDEIARLFLEYAVEAYERGEIVINPVLVEGRLRIFEDYE